MCVGVEFIRGIASKSLTCMCIAIYGPWCTVHTLVVAGMGSDAIVIPAWLGGAPDNWGG